MAIDDSLRNGELEFSGEILKGLRHGRANCDDFPNVHAAGDVETRVVWARDVLPGEPNGVREALHALNAKWGAAGLYGHVSEEKGEF